jgi:hypothetical protein
MVALHPASDTIFGKKNPPFSFSLILLIIGIFDVNRISIFQKIPRIV